MKSAREQVQEHRASTNGHGEPGAIALLDHDERAHQGTDEATMWCPKCEERAVAMRDGTCGFCDTPLVAPPALADEDDWPHTEVVVRRQLVDDEQRLHGRIKREHNGQPARGPILSRPTAEEERIAGELEAPQPNSDPSKSPILDWLKAHAKGSAPQIADALERKPGNVSTRLRQLEQRGYVRRTGRTVPGGRGGPQIEWELSSDEKPPTDIDQPLTSPHSPSDLTVRYFDALLALLDTDCPEHIFDRLERLATASDQEARHD